jgi:5,10-methylene-tetrahydrofolate dehydrogenase/methenyl tetrahydrofolate cyclohydrolase
MSSGDAPDPKKIDGKALAATIAAEVKKGVEALVSSTGVTPSVAVILVGDRPDSSTYVRMKKSACEEAGITFKLCSLKTDVTEAELVALVKSLNADASVHGILVQLPLPAHIDQKNVLTTVSPDKDVDGFHAVHMGALAMRGHDPLFVPCTPKGCIEILKREKIPIAGKNAVVIGRSNIVGIPAALLLIKEDATVTIAHSRTANLPDVVRQADIVIAAVGKTEMVKGDWLKPGAVVIDVGINSKDDPSLKRGYRLVGDVDYASAYPVAGRITPVPGGVGPMTVAMLLTNTLDSAKRHAQGKVGSTGH